MDTCKNRLKRPLSVARVIDRYLGRTLVWAKVAYGYFIEFVAIVIG